MNTTLHLKDRKFSKSLLLSELFFKGQLLATRIVLSKYFKNVI